MIVFQSPFCVGRANSPEGCGRLAGDNIPGHQPNNPCALKGRWREPADLACPYSFRPVLCSFYSNLRALCASVAKIRVHLCPSVVKPRNCKTNPISTSVIWPFKGFQSLSKRFKAIQRVGKTFFIFGGDSRRDRNQSKSTLAGSDTNQIPAHTGRKMNLHRSCII